MAHVSPGTEGPDYINRRNDYWGDGYDGDNIQGNGGNDTIFGGGGRDLIDGGSGNDYIDGGNGDDYGLNGGSGNDTIYGGTGNDWLYGNEGDDYLLGESGLNRLIGGSGNDYYYHSSTSDGTIISDTYSDGTGGGGTDTIRFQGVNGADLQLFKDSTDLYIASLDDLTDGQIDHGIVIANFFLGGDYLIEYVVGQDGAGYDLGLIYSLGLLG